MVYLPNNSRHRDWWPLGAAVAGSEDRQTVAAAVSWRTPARGADSGHSISCCVPPRRSTCRFLKCLATRQIFLFLDLNFLDRAILDSDLKNPMQLNCGLSKVQIMFFYLNLRLSCERYRKNMVRAWTKILWWMGIRSTFLMGEPFLLTLLWLNSLSPGCIKLYVYIQGRLFIHFGRDISITLSSIPLCVTSIMLFPKPITYTSADIIYVLCTNM